MKSPKLLWLVLPLGLILLALPGLVSTAWNLHCVNGKGSKITQKRDFESFEGVALQFAGDVEITQGPALTVEIEAQENLMELIEIKVKNGTLKIGVVDGKCIGNNDGITVRVTSPKVQRLSVAGSGDIRAMSPIKTETLDIAVSGSGDIRLKDLTADDMNVSIAGSGTFSADGNGSAEALQVQISGSGDVQLSNVQASEVQVSISGSGDVQVWAEKELEVSIMGSGDVTYKGNAKLTRNVLGSGDIHHQD